MTVDQHAPDLLLERDRELEHAAEVLAGAIDGRGAVLLVEGPAGIGKTRVARAVAEAATARGFDVHRARGDELEHGFAYGVLRQLLVSMLDGLDAADRAAALKGPASLVVPILEGADGAGNDDGDAEGVGLSYGFSRLLGDLAERRPRLVWVDDAHWADLRSLGALRFACRRSTELPVVAVITYRHPRDAQRHDALEWLTTLSNSTRLALSPLGPRAVSVLADAVLHEQSNEAFCRDLLRSTGGNPFLVHEMLGAAKAQEPPSDRLDVTDLEQLVPARVVRSVRRRIAAVGGHAAQLADAVAVLGDAPLRDAARLAELDESAAVTAADRLAATGILTAGSMLRYVHPILRRAVTARIPPARLSLTHARRPAARGRRRAARTGCGAPAGGAAAVRSVGRGHPAGRRAACSAPRLARDRGASVGPRRRRAPTGTPAIGGHPDARRDPGAAPSSRGGRYRAARAGSRRRPARPGRCATAADPHARPQRRLPVRSRPPRRPARGRRRS